MAIPAEGLPQRRIPQRRRISAREQGLVEPLRITDGITRGDLSRLLREAAREARDLVESGMVSRVRADQLRAAMGGMRGLSDRLWLDVTKLIREGVLDAATLAADHQLLRELNMGMPEGLLTQYADNMYFLATQSAEDLLSRHTAGFTLNQRVYRNSQATVLQVGTIIDRALAQQLSAREIAARVRSFISPDTPGGTGYAAMRLARTEINNAHHETTIRTTKDRPWVLGYRWHLSGSHPRPDICNTYASEGDGTGGEGVFSKDNVPSKPHPQCLCFLAIAQEPRDQFLRKLQGGEYDNHLRGDGVTTRLPSETARTKFRSQLTDDDSDVREIRRIASEKIKNAPRPTQAQIEKAHAELAKAKAGLGRAGGDSRGGSAASRRKQRQNLFDEFGGNERGYVPCHGCGVRMHHASPKDSELNPQGYERFERGKIWVKCQGGGYQLPNLLPECFGCNRSRGDTFVREEIQC